MKVKVYTWIETAIYKGDGRLTVERVGDIFYALMSWKQVPATSWVTGKGKTLEEALDNLETNLLEDAANEMVEKGAV